VANVPGMKLIYAVAVGVSTFFALNCGSGDEGTPAPAPTTAEAGSAPSPAGASVVEVKVVGHDFDPPAVTIKKDQTVRWVWVSGNHNVVSGTSCTSDGRFTSGASASPPSTFEHTFTESGTFPYFCDPHCTIGMTGTVTVE
jgi:plastocyanin